MTDKINKVREVLNEAEDIEMDGVPVGEPDEGPPDPPFDHSPDGPDHGGPGHFAADGPVLEIEGAQFPLNDSGNGKRFAHYCGDDALFVPRVGWHIWDTRRWRLDPDGIAVRRHAQTIQHRIVAEIPHVVLEDWQLEALAQEPNIRRLFNTIADIDADERTAEQATEHDALSVKLDWIKKLKEYRSKMKSEHRSFAKTSGNKGRIDGLLGEAITDLNRDVEDLDADPLTVNTQSGILRFTVTDMREEGGGQVADMALLDHERAIPIAGRNQPQYITKMMPVDYDPAAKCPKFDAFLARVQPDREVRAFLQRWFGLSMTALPVQKFLYCYGMGANGKSLLANLMRRMLGDYATMVKIESLTGKNRRGGADATPDLMKLIGARAAITNEPEEGERLQEQKVKEMTGGDSMLVRQLHTDFVEFTPYFKLMFTGNHKLEIRGTDDGIWRRPLLCPFDVQIPEAERNEKLGDRLFDEERSGILNWMIDGLIDYLDGGLQEPAQILDATQEYRADSDPIGDFLATACEIDGGTDWLPARDLIDACYLYQLENSAYAWSPGVLSRKLKDRHGKYMHPVTGKTYTRHKRGVWGYSGVQLTPDMRYRLDNAPRDAKGMPCLPKTDRGGPFDRPPSDDGDDDI